MLILIVMTGLGLIFGVILAFANKKLAVEMNPLIHIVEDVLPKGQCGACGYAGCQAYAEAVVLNPDVPPNLCIPGKEVVAKAVAEITGKQAAASEPRMAHVQCNGTVGKAVFDFHYEGVKDCLAASLLQGGPKQCRYGCLGQGTCVAKCPFGALTLSAENLPVVNLARCTGCAVCAAVNFLPDLPVMNAINLSGSFFSSIICLRHSGSAPVRTVARRQGQGCATRQRLCAA